MLREKALLFRKLNIALDAFVTALSFYASFIIFTFLWPKTAYTDLLEYLPILYFALPLWYIIFRINRMYESHRTISTQKVIRIITKSVVEGIVLLILISFFLFPKTQSIDRMFYLLFGFFNILFLISERILLKQFLYTLRSRGYNFRNVLIIGTGNRAKSLATRISAQKEWGLNIYGFLTQDDEEDVNVFQEWEVIGKLEDLHEAACTAAVPYSA